MVVARRIKEYLEQNGVEYKSLVHPTAYTAQEVAATTHIRGKEVAKVVMVKVDDKMIMAVLPAAHKIDLAQLKEVLGVKKVELATEDEFKEMFPDCEIGAQPPFGNLYNLEVIAAKPLWENEEITFNAGTHTDVITIPFSDWERLVKPRQVEFTQPI